LVSECVIVGKCSRFYYLGVLKKDLNQQKQDDNGVLSSSSSGSDNDNNNDKDDNNNKNNIIFELVAFVPHCGFDLSSSSNDSSSNNNYFPCKYPPKDRVSLSLFESSKINNNNNFSLPRPMHEISWIASKQQNLWTCQMISYRAVLDIDPSKHILNNNNNQNQNQNNKQDKQLNDQDAAFDQYLQNQNNFNIPIVAQRPPRLTPEQIEIKNCKKAIRKLQFEDSYI
jgi:hypothetical protein